MGKTISSFIRLMAVIGALCLISACAVTTASIESSSETIGNTSDASSKLTSSTSPSGGSSNTAKNEQALAFVKVKFERVKTDMAVGEGEHLTSLATLLGIPDHNQKDFFALTKANFSSLFSSEQTTAEELLARLSDEISANPRLLN